jgi:hypothetical protein
LTDQDLTDFRSLNVTLDSLLNGSSLIPSANFTELTVANDLQSTQLDKQAQLLFFDITIPLKELNLLTLRNYADIELDWTDSICEHLLVTEIRGRPTLLVFDRPTVINLPRPKGVDLSFMGEVEKSYAALFRAYDAHKHSRGCWKKIACWGAQWTCKSCRLYTIVQGAVQKLKSKPDEVFDPLIDEIIEDDKKYQARDWRQDEYPILWPRIKLLSERMRKGRPRGFRILFSDKRDSKEFWTIWYVSKS